jgi:hypothetical protein
MALRFVLRWLRRTAPDRINHISGMSERELDDIGLRSGALSSVVDRDLGRTRLVDFGWRLGR